MSFLILAISQEMLAGFSLYYLATSLWLSFSTRTFSTMVILSSRPYSESFLTAYFLFGEVS